MCPRLETRVSANVWTMLDPKTNCDGRSPCFADGETGPSVVLTFDAMSLEKWAVRSVRLSESIIGSSWLAAVAATRKPVDLEP